VSPPSAPQMPPSTQAVWITTAYPSPQVESAPHPRPTPPRLPPSVAQSLGGEPIRKWLHPHTCPASLRSRERGCDRESRGRLRRTASSLPYGRRRCGRRLNSRQRRCRWVSARRWRCRGTCRHGITGRYEWTGGRAFGHLHWEVRRVCAAHNQQQRSHRRVAQHRECRSYVSVVTRGYT
jgi:hypothetical protein